jgi:tetratricopeptide (TPR) repeat protein
MAIFYPSPFDLFQQMVDWLSISASSYRKGRSYLEKNQMLLHEDIDKELQRLITAHAEDHVEIKQQIEHLALIRDIRSRAPAMHSIREAYVNRYGGFTLDLPVWLEEIEKQLLFLKNLRRPERTSRRQEQLLRHALERASADSELAAETRAEILNQLGCVLAQGLHYTVPHERQQACYMAIDCHKEALQIFTVERYPLQYARTCARLGYAYQRAHAKSSADDQERAIACYKEALCIYEQKYCPEQRAEVQTELGKLYTQSITGKAEENIALALSYHEAALASIRKDMSPTTWATIQINLGDTYLRFGNKDHGFYRERALACYRKALSVYTLYRYPREWAAIHVRLAAIFQSYAEWQRCERDICLRCAIVCSEAALLVYSIDAFPIEYAATLVYLGYLHSIRADNDQISNLEQACRCYRRALRVFTRQDFPEECELVLSNLSEAEGKRRALGQFLR